MLKDSSFQSRGAATANDLSPQLRFYFASWRSCLFPERSVCVGEYCERSSDKQEGAILFMHVYAIMRNLKQFFDWQEDWQEASEVPLRVRTVAKRHMSSPCLQHLLFWFHVSNYRNFWNNERWKSVLNTLASWNCFTCRNLFQNGANDMSECLTFEAAFCKKAQNFV